jgi:Protein of unknown function (DUF726)
MGMPNHMSHSSWHACRQVVAGRLVNCFSRKDLILSLMFQYKKFGFKAGTRYIGTLFWGVLFCRDLPILTFGICYFNVSSLWDVQRRRSRC